MKRSDVIYIKRLTIFFFYDKDGVVDRYIPHMLQDIVKNTSELLVVVNGALNEAGRWTFLQITPNLLVRENMGFDVWAYKAGMEYYGWDKLAEFDEVVFMNFTIMGPLYPFREMFEVMDKRNVDFWGLTLFHNAPFDPFGKIEYGYLPLHLQSHFIAVRSNMLKSESFQTYWNKRPMITCYEEAVCWHEAIFTKRFEDLGFTWDVYIDTRDMLDHSYSPLLMAPVELVKNRRCPIVKRRSFFHNYYDFLDVSTGHMSAEILAYIRGNLNYDTDMIWENILRVQNMADIKTCLHLNYILPEKVEKNVALSLIDKKIALVLHCYFTDLIKYCFVYAQSMPPESDVYITTDTNAKAEEIYAIFSKGHFNKVVVIVIENRGRDVSALLVATKRFIMNYDYVCFAHDKKVGQIDRGIIGESFSHKCFENILKSSAFVKNVINQFEQNPRMGLLTPPPPNHGPYYPVVGRVDWGCNFTNTVELAKKLGIRVSMDYDKEPIAPLGTMFWFRPVAMKPLFAHDWEYADFPAEPNGVDGTLLHAIERVYPFVAQQEGYYSAWLLCESFAQVEMTNSFYMLRELNRAVFSIYGPNTHYNLLCMLKEEKYKNGEHTNMLLRVILKEKLRKWLPKPLFNFAKKAYRFLFRRKSIRQKEL